MAEPATPKLIGELAGAIERRDVRYLFTGSVATRLWGLHYPSTAFEVVIEAEKDAMPALCRDLTDLGFRVPDQYLEGWIDYVDAIPHLDLTYYDGAIIFDVALILVATPFQKSAIERRRSVKVGEREIPVISPEDLLLHKLLGGRPRDMVDATEILVATPNLDMGYVRKWARDLDVEFNLSQAETDAREFFGPPPPSN